MKKKVLIISGAILLLIIIGALVLFLSEDNRDKLQERMFLSFNRISCISVNHIDNPYPGDQVKTYSIEPSAKVLDGYLYDDSDAKKFVYDLIKDGIIRTFGHISADVCLISYEEDTENILLKYKARQLYYTNYKNIEYYNFSVTIDKTDKSITLQEE